MRARVCVLPRSRGGSVSLANRDVAGSHAGSVQNTRGQGWVLVTWAADTTSYLGEPSPLSLHHALAESSPFSVVGAAFPVDVSTRKARSLRVPLVIGG